METGYCGSHTIIEVSEHHGSFLYGTLFAFREFLSF